MEARILMVEDDAGLRQMLIWELEDLGYRVSAAADCAQALRLMRGQGFDAALLDYCLPDGNGIDLLIALQALAPALPVILCSALAGSEIRAHARELGALDFLTKPTTVQRLDRAFRQALDMP